MWPLLASGFSSTVLWPPASETELQHQQWVWHLGIFPPLLFPSSKSQGGRARGWRVSSSLPTTTPVSSRESAFRTSSIGPKTIKNKQNAGRFFFSCSSWSPSRTSSPKQLWRQNVKISKPRKWRPMMTFSAHEWARRNVETRQKTHHQDLTAPCSHTLWKLE